jgi:hypothetical protein
LAPRACRRRLGTSLLLFATHAGVAKHLLQAALEPIELSAEELTQIERTNPCSRERHVESSRPGELFGQDTLFVGTIRGVGKVYLHPSKVPAAAMEVLLAAVNTPSAA